MRRALVAAALAAGLAAVAASACRAPTQAMLVVTRQSGCANARDVTLTVGAEPGEVQERQAKGFVSASTTSCDPVGSKVGSLVVTPGEDHASILVVAGVGGRPATDCKAPSFAGCIVARRRFAFIAHATLTIPISLEESCIDVPCDAYTSCRSGRCYSAQLECADPDACRLEGELSDGGVDPDASILVDGSPPRDDGSTADGGDDGGPRTDGNPTDGPLDSPDDVVAPGDAGDNSCDIGGNLKCDGIVCAPNQACCYVTTKIPEGWACGSAGVCKVQPRLCCQSSNCSSFVGQTNCKNRSGPDPGQCGP